MAVTSVAVQWLRLRRPVVETSPSNAGSAGSIPGRGTKIPHAWGPKTQNIKQKQYCNKFNKDFKNGRHQKILKQKQKHGGDENQQLVLG